MVYGSFPETKRAFAIDREDPRLRDRYGRNRFGQSCLLARRLIESGARFVTVSGGGWGVGDIAGAVRFLISDDSRYVIGQTISVAGGAELSVSTGWA